MDCFKLSMVLLLYKVIFLALLPARITCNRKINSTEDIKLPIWGNYYGRNLAAATVINNKGSEELPWKKELNYAEDNQASLSPYESLLSPFSLDPGANDDDDSGHLVKRRGRPTRNKIVPKPKIPPPPPNPPPKKMENLGVDTPPAPPKPLSVPTHLPPPKPVLKPPVKHHPPPKPPPTQKFSPPIPPKPSQRTKSIPPTPPKPPPHSPPPSPKKPPPHPKLLPPPPPPVPTRPPPTPPPPPPPLPPPPPRWWGRTMEDPHPPPNPQPPSDTEPPPNSEPSDPGQQSGPEPSSNEPPSPDSPPPPPEPNEYCHTSSEQIPPIDFVVIKKNVTEAPLDEIDGRWKNWQVNRYYGVKRDLFYMQNTETRTATVQFRIEPTTEATLMGIHEGWKHEYVLARVELYWSLIDTAGSCHSINQLTYPFEIQAIHYKKSAKSLNEAASQPSGILILCSLYELADEDNHALEPFVKNIDLLSTKDFKMHRVHGPLDFKTLFPYDLSNIQYTRSYPFIPCAKEASYVVFTNTQSISVRQLAHFRKLKDPQGKLHPGVFAPYSAGIESKTLEVHYNYRMQIMKLEDFSRAAQIRPNLYPIYNCNFMLIISLIISVILS